MIDQVSNKGYALLSAPATVTSSGAGSGVLNLLVGPGGTGSVNAPTLGQPQGTIAFVLAATAGLSTTNGTLTSFIQTCSDNATFSNATYSNGTLFAFQAVSNVANTGGVQTLFVDSAFLSQYSRVYDLASVANVSSIRSVTAVFVPKNP